MPRGPLGIFIADDSELLQGTLAASLEAIPNSVVLGRAFTGGDALRGVAIHSPDVLLLDLHMPGGDGLDVLEALRKLGVRPLIIMMSFESDPAVRRRCFQLGAHLYFDKAGDLNDIVDLISALASGERTLGQLKTDGAQSTETANV